MTLWGLSLLTSLLMIDSNFNPSPVLVRVGQMFISAHIIHISGQWSSLSLIWKMRTVLWCLCLLQVISFYLDCFPQSQHSLVLERLQYIMPNNTELLIRYVHQCLSLCLVMFGSCRNVSLLWCRSLQQEWQDGNVEHLKSQSRMSCGSAATCLAIWRM